MDYSQHSIIEATSHGMSWRGVKSMGGRRTCTARKEFVSKHNRLKNRVALNISDYRDAATEL